MVCTILYLYIPVQTGICWNQILKYGMYKYILQLDTCIFFILWHCFMMFRPHGMTLPCTVQHITVPKLKTTLCIPCSGNSLLRYVHTSTYKYILCYITFHNLKCRHTSLWIRPDQPCTADVFQRLACAFPSLQLPSSVQSPLLTDHPEVACPARIATATG